MLEQQMTYIYSLEGKDLHSRTLKIKKNKRFKAALDYSLEAMQIETVAKAIYKDDKKENIFYQDNGKQYTRAVINITFKYNVKDYNLITVKKKQYYVRLDSKLDNKSIINIVFENGIYGSADNIIAIEIDSESTLTNKELPQGFSNKDNKIYLNSTGIETVSNSDEIREELYENGFTIKYGNEKVNYVRFKRSSGSSRVGKCLFIDEILYKDMLEWSMMGLEYGESDEIDLAAVEAYISLTTSSIIDTMVIEPCNILLIDDYESIFEDTAMVTTIEKRKVLNEDGEEEEVDRLKTKPDRITIANKIWDGQSLLDSSFFEDNYKDKGFLLLRNRFYKSACFNCNIQQFFIDNNITDISQLNGKTLATNIKDIKMITTPSSIKYLKMGEWKGYISRLTNLFGIVKYDKPTHYFDGEMVQTHYQLLNTLQLKKHDVEELLKDSLDYIYLLKNDIRVFREHLHIKINENIQYGNINTTSDFMFIMLQLNNEFINTDIFIKFRQDTIDSYVRNIKRGHVLIHGNYSVLCGNSIEMLKATIKDKNHKMAFDGESFLDVDEVYCKNFKYNTPLLGCRSPHVTIGNIWLFKNTNKEKADFINKYFNSSKQIIYINSIKTNVLEQLSSSDFDSDQLIVTDQKLLISTARKNYNNFLVPTSKVEATKVPRVNTAKEKCDLDIKTSKNLIGEIINCSQILNSKLWDMIAKGKTVDDDNVQDLYAIISQLDVMSCIEIDKAKKEFSIDNKFELEQIREAFVSNSKKPLFMKFISEDKGNKVKGNKFEKHRTTMDYLLEVVNKNMRVIRKKRTDSNKLITLGDLFSMERTIKLAEADRKQVDIVIKSCENLRIETGNIWKNETMSGEEKYESANEIKNKFMDNIGNLKISSATIKKIIYTLNKNSVKIKNGEIVKSELNRSARKLLGVLYVTHAENFIKIFEETKEKIDIIKRSNKAKNDKNVIKIYDLSYIIHK